MEGQGSWAILRDIGCMEGFLVVWFGGLDRGKGGGEGGCIGGYWMKWCMVWLEII